MARIKYTPGGERRRFQQRGQGLRAGEQRIQEQAQIGIDAMKLAALRQEKLDNQFISGLSDKNRFEQNVLREKQELEGKARTRKYEAFKKFADTDVARMEGEADELKKKADFWKDFAPKFAKNLGTLATGLLAFQDRVRGQNRLEEMRKSGLLKSITDGVAGTEYKLETNANLDRTKLRKEGQFPLSNQIGKVINSNSHWLSLRIAEFAKENKTLIRDDIIASFGKDNYSAENAVEVQTYGMHMFMEKAGISPKSEGGRKLLDQATNVGILDRRNILAQGEAEKTSQLLDVGQEDIKVALKKFFSEEDEFGLNSAALYLKLNTQMNNRLDGYFVENGRLDSPLSGPRNKQETYTQILQNIVKNNYKWMTREQVEIVLSLDVPSLEGEKTESYIKKFPTQANEILEEYDTSKRAQDDNANDLQVQNSINRMNTVLTEIETKYEGKVPTKYQRYEDVNTIMKDPLLLSNQKAQILTKWGFDASNHKDMQWVGLIHNNIVDGDVDEIERLLRSKEIKPEEKIRILSKVSQLKELQEYGPIGLSTLPGALGFFEKGDNLFDALQEVYPGTSQGQGLTPSANYSLSEYKSFSIQTYLDARKNGMSLEEAIIHTTTELDKAWAAGAHPTNKAKLGTGIFARQLVNGKWLFPRHEDIDPKALQAFNNPLKDEDYQGSGEWQTLASLEISDKKTALEHMLLKDPDTNVSDTYLNVEQLLTHDRVTNKVEMVQFANQLKNYTLHSSSKDKKVVLGDFDVPYGFHILSNYTGKPLAEVVNTWIEAKLASGNENWNFLKDIKMPADKTALLDLINGDKHNNERNIKAATYVNGSLAKSGLIPRKKQVNAALDAVKAGDDRTQIVKNLFSESTGIEWSQNEDGKWTFSDKNGFLSNGGWDLPINATPTEMLEQIGYDPQSFIQSYDQRLKNIQKYNKGLERYEQLPFWMKL